MHTSDPPFHNLLEPPAYVRLFREFPPLDFDCCASPTDLPLFCTDFDLLTTLEPRTRSFLESAPFISRGTGFFTWPACFAGTTITEYAPLPKGSSPKEILDALLHARPAPKALYILKDLPKDSPLLPEDDNVFAREVTETALAGGFIAVQGQALAYVSVDFASQEEYLSRLSSGRRKDLRRKLRKKASLDIQVLPLGHPELGGHDFLHLAHALYLEVFEQSDIHFDLLSREFFDALFQGRDIPGVVFLYRHNGRLAGYNICLEHNNKLVDKYIGFSYPLARELNLYFISWMVNLEYARQRGFTHYIAGWTDPEVKASLGASFTFTRHLVRVRNPVLRSVLRPLRRLFEADAAALGSAAG